MPGTWQVPNKDDCWANRWFNKWVNHVFLDKELSDWRGSHFLKALKYRHMHAFHPFIQEPFIECLLCRQWHPTPVLLPGKSHGWRSLVGYSPWGREESDTTEQLRFHFSLFLHWRRKWQPTPVFLPGESQGRGSLVGCRLWGHTESDTTEAT